MATLTNTPKFFEFNHDVDEWEIYYERLQQHFIVNSVENEKTKAAVLLSSIGQSTFKLLKNLIYPKPIEEEKFEDLCDLLKIQFSAQKSTWRERIKYYQISQGNTSISEWHATVREAATSCEFGNQLMAVLKDKFVTGLSPGKIQDRLCEEDTNKELKDLYSLALKMENSIKEVHFAANSRYPSSKFPPKMKYQSEEHVRSPTQGAQARGRQRHRNDSSHQYGRFDQVNGGRMNHQNSQEFW